MRGKSHLICAAITGLAASFFFSDFSFDSTVLVLTGSCVGGLAPDIDIPESIIGKIVKPIARTINKLFGHRTITHSGLWIIPILILYIRYPNLFLMGYLIGFIGHLLSDTLTCGGVPWVYPFSRKRLRLTKIKSGVHDGVLTSLSVSIMLLAFIGITYIREVVLCLP